MEADLQSVYGVDLADLYTGRMTPRRCWLLIEQLPPGSRLSIAIGGDSAWTTETHAIVSMLTMIRKDLAGKDASKIKPPAPPEVGWQEKRRETQRHLNKRAARYHRARTKASPKN